MDRLTEKEIEEALLVLPHWKLDNKTITRRFQFDTFVGAMEFTNKVAEMAEEQQHHPFISIDYRVVTLRLTSWHAGGLTQLDVDAARKYDELYSD